MGEEAGSQLSGSGKDEALAANGLTANSYAPRGGKFGIKEEANISDAGATFSRVYLHPSVH